MPGDVPPAGDVLSRLAELVGLGRETSLGSSLEALERQTRAQLLDWCQRLGLANVSRLTKAHLARRLDEVLRTVGARGGGGEYHAPAPPAAPDVEPPDVARKFALGRQGRERPAAEHIPWSYGQDRVTALVVDPDRLYVYWEATDEALARARDGLGAGGPGAWMDLRVYDVTGRLFDGTNAHSYFDHRVERGDRQWFFDLHRPGSAAVVELGLRSHEGYFVRLARSGRVEFPRRDAAPGGGVEWLTVRAASGAVAVPEPAPPDDAALDEAAGTEFVPIALWHALRGPGGEGMAPEERLVPGAAFERRAEWQETFHTEWSEDGRTLAWRGPVVRSTWEAGPFRVPVESPVYVEERADGGVTVTRAEGRLHVVYGPWRVVIRGLGAHAERDVLATWEMQCAWTTAGDVEHAVAAGPALARAGASEGVAAGASERRWLAASELRLGGASELWRIGASELRLIGASERLALGASERRLRGASELRYAGASEWRYGGGSERGWGGASERSWLGGSERRLGEPGREADDEVRWPDSIAGRK